MKTAKTVQQTRYEAGKDKENKVGTLRIRLNIEIYKLQDKAEGKKI